MQVIFYTDTEISNDNDTSKEKRNIDIHIMRLNQ